MKSSRIQAHIARLLVLSMFILILLSSVVTTGLAESESLRRFSGADYFKLGYSVYASAVETEAGSYDVDVSVQFTPDFPTVDYPTSFKLNVGSNESIDVVADDALRKNEVMTEFHATATIDDPTQTIKVVPVFEKGGTRNGAAVTLAAATDGWDEHVGTVATVRNPQSDTRLNLRNTPSEKASVWMQYYNGVPLYITNALPDGWVAVTVGNKDSNTRGYMKSEFIAFGEEAEQVASFMPVHRSNIISFTLYSLPKESSEIINTFANGTDMKVLGISKKWWHVQVGDVLGYVRIGAAGVATQTPEPAATVNATATPEPAATINATATPVPAATAIATATPEPAATAIATTAPEPAEKVDATAIGTALRTYNAQYTTGKGYVIDAAVTETSADQFDLKVALGVPSGSVPNTATSYNLYINDKLASSAEALVQDDSSTVQFESSFTFSGTIDSLRLIPVTDKGIEETDEKEFIDIAVK